VSLMKRFAVTERVALAVEGILFNALNHANLGASNGNLSCPFFEQVTSTFVRRRRARSNSARVSASETWPGSFVYWLPGLSP
jgi:hypothetical protein